MLDLRHASGAVLLTAGALLAWACNSDRPKELQPRASTSVSAPASPALDDSSFRFPPGSRLLAVGDVHGDVDAARRVLRLAKVIDEKDAWIGGKSVVVQTGDQLDRGDQEPEVLDLFEKLAGKAKQAGGAFHVLNGNHEIMNVAGDFRYVTADGFEDYKDTPLVGLRGKKAVLLPEQQRGRAGAFLPGGPVALKLAERPVIIAVGETVFAHGGVLPGHVRYGIGRINAETRLWMRGETQRAPAILEGDASPVWTRDYSEGEPSPRVCKALDTVLENLRVRRMVVGHTLQKAGISSACGEKVWRIDVGLARHYGGEAALLEIEGQQVRVLGGPAPAAP